MGTNDPNQAPPQDPTAQDAAQVQPEAPAQTEPQTLQQATPEQSTAGTEQDPAVTPTMDPTQSADPNAPPPVGVPVQTDLGGQQGPSPDTIGVPAGERSTQTIPPPDNLAVQADIGPGTTDTGPEVDEEDPEDATRAVAAEENGVPRGAPVPNAPDGGEYQGATDSVSVLDSEDADVVRSSDTVLVSLDDPAAGAAVSRWLEREAARDPRLGPLVDRLQYLPNVRIQFDASDPIFQEARPAQEQVTGEPATT